MIARSFRPELLGWQNTRCEIRCGTQEVAAVSSPVRPDGMAFQLRVATAALLIAVATVFTAELTDRDTALTILLAAGLAAATVRAFGERHAPAEDDAIESAGDHWPPPEEPEDDPEHDPEHEDATLPSLDNDSMLLESLAIPVYVKDREGHYAGCNWAFEAFVGRSRDDLIGRHASLLLSPEATEEVDRSDRAVLETGDVQIHEIVLRRADGALRHVLLHKSAVPAADGSIGGIVGVINDVTERKQAEEAMRLAAEVFEHIGEGLLVIDENRTIVTVNRAFTEITGYSANEALGQNPEFLLADPGDGRLRETIERSLAESGVWRGELVQRRKNGEAYIVWGTVAGVRDEDGSFHRYVSMFTDITALRAREERIRHLAQHDPLTGLANRVLFEDVFRETLVHARHDGTTVGLLLLDLDRFKQVNDTLGHAAGDELLRQAAQRIKQVVRETDTVARLGGDEFAVLLAASTRTPNVERIAGDLVAALAEPFDLGAGTADIGTSIGVALWPHDGEDRETLIRAADAAMYRAKREGRNGWRLADPSFGLGVGERAGTSEGPSAAPDAA